MLPISATLFLDKVFQSFNKNIIIESNVRLEHESVGRKVLTAWGRVHEKGRGNVNWEDKVSEVSGGSGVQLK